MRKIGNLLVGAALAGALAAGIAAAPAASAATAGTTAATSASQKGRFGPIWSDDHRAYARGGWGRQGGYYYADFDLFDRHRDSSYAWFDVYYHDNRGWHFYNRYKTFGSFGKKIFFNKNHRIDGFRFNVGHGTKRDYNWSGWHKYGSF